MFKNVEKQTLRKQAGFTLVELSVVLVVVGLLFAAVVKGQEMVDLTKSIKLLNDMKNVEALIQAHAITKGRMPGDCNGDGVIDMAADQVPRTDASNSTRADLYDFSAAKSVYAAASAATSGTEGCMEIGGLPATDTAISANTWINDLKISGLLSDSVVNRTYAKQVNEDMMFVGHITEKNGTTSGGGQYNAMVIHNVPQWMARYVSTAINGTGAVAHRNRVRSLKLDGTDGQYEEKWDTSTAAGSATAGTGNQRNSMVSLVYFFDRIPATSN